MNRRILFILTCLILSLPLSLYAAEIKQDALNQGTLKQETPGQGVLKSVVLKQDAVEQPVIATLPPVISSLPEEKINNRPEILYDYSSNELAMGAVKRNITLFSEKIRERFSLWLTRSGKYLELMKDILKEKNVPEEIVFLSLIESGFSPNAYSTARAAGYWQFIASTAKRYGLEIDWWRDERRDR
jgi:hypothetical protein